MQESNICTEHEKSKAHASASTAPAFPATDTNYLHDAASDNMGSEHACLTGEGEPVLEADTEVNRGYEVN